MRALGRTSPQLVACSKKRVLGQRAACRESSISLRDSSDFDARERVESRHVGDVGGRDSVHREEERKEEREEREELHGVRKRGAG